MSSSRSGCVLPGSPDLPRIPKAAQLTDAEAWGGRHLVAPTLSLIRSAQGTKQKAFCTYIRKNWLPHLEKWCKGSLENIDHSGAFTNAHIEAYHAVLKSLHLKGRKRLCGRRLDWLIDNLYTHVDEYYW